MDKRIILAVAGSGKTSYIVDSLNRNKHSLIITYTNNNYNNIAKKIANRFNGTWPENISLMTFFQFLYSFCYKPFLSDQYRAKGVIFKANSNRRLAQDQKAYYLSPSGCFYSNRLSLFLDKAGVIPDIQKRIATYFDEFVIDEVQDISGRDFVFLEQLMRTNVNMLFVGDFFQHTYSTSLDGNTNKNLFENYSEYMKRFLNNGMIIDTKSLLNSWRCSRTVCDYVSNNLGIAISSNRSDDTVVKFVSKETELLKILNDDNIVKLHYQNSGKFGPNHKNWGDTKGEDCYDDVCIMLNKETIRKYKNGKLFELAPLTRNKLYVAITRAHGNVYFVEE